LHQAVRDHHGGRVDKGKGDDVGRREDERWRGAAACEKRGGEREGVRREKEKGREEMRGREGESERGERREERREKREERREMRDERGERRRDER
jgi:hypothetical protein